MNDTEASNKPLLQKKVSGKKADLRGWEYVCTFGNCLVYANGDKRCLIKAETGEVIFKYTVNIYNTQPDNNGKRGQVTGNR